MLQVLLTTHNSEKYLAELLDSLCFQTLRDFEVVVSDDCSTDSTLGILARYRDNNRFKAFTVYAQEKPLGFVRNFEFLLSKVTAEYFALCDHDDVWLPDKLERCLGRLVSSGASLAYCDLAVTDDSLNVTAPSMQRLNNSLCKTRFTGIRAVFLYNIVTGCTIVARSSVIPRALPVPDGIIHDWWLALAAALDGGLCYVDEPLILYRQHSGNEIGAKNAAQKAASFDEYRRGYIDFKISHLKLFADFLALPEDYAALRADAVDYYSRLSGVCRFSLKGLGVFRRLYRGERVKRRLFSLLMLHMPCLIRPFFAPR